MSGDLEQEGNAWPLREASGMETEWMEEGELGEEIICVLICGSQGRLPSEVQFTHPSLYRGNPHN